MAGFAFAPSGSAIGQTPTRPARVRLRGGAGSSSRMGVKPQVPGQTQARATDVRMWCGGSAACMHFAKAPTGQRRGQAAPATPGPSLREHIATDRAPCEPPPGIEPHVCPKAVPERRQRPARPLAQRVTALPRRSHAMAPVPVAQVRLVLQAKRPGLPPDDRACVRSARPAGWTDRRTCACPCARRNRRRGPLRPPASSRGP